MPVGAPGGAGGPREPGMWQQFRRRRVTRTVLLYLACMFLVVESYLFVAQHVALPPWGFRVLMGAAVLGFPFTVVLAWTYDVTPTGIVRTPEEPGPEPPPSPGPRLGWALLGAAALGAGLVIRMLRM